MKRRIRFLVAGLFTLALGVALPGRDAAAQTASALVGTYALVSITSGEGTAKVDIFGPQPYGQLTLSPDGRFSQIEVRVGQPKYAADSRLKGTPEEYKATVEGTLAFFGTYTVNDANNAIVFHVIASTYPNYTATDQKRTFTVVGDELHFTNTTPSIGGGTTTQLVWKRNR